MRHYLTYAPTTHSVGEDELIQFGETSLIPSTYLSFEQHNRHVQGWQPTHISAAKGGAKSPSQAASMDATTSIRQAREHLLAHLPANSSHMQADLQIASRSDDILPTILSQVCNLLQVSGVVLTMLDLNTGETIVDLTCGNWQDHLSHAGSYYPEPATRTDEKQEHLACVPLFVQETIIGTLCVSHTGALTPDSLRVLEAMGNIAANAVFDQQRVRRERQQTYDSTLEGWVYALELRDNETKDHTRRVTAMTVELARACGMRGDDLVQVWRGALLHDIGKIAIPDSILLKPGKLTEEEWQIMREHPRYAYDMLISIPFLQAALDIPYYHHEKWDGTGYPYGLQGEDIPLAARIFAVVDVWDALRFDRPYRKAWSEQRVIEHLIALAGTHFDPHIVDIFLDLLQTRPHIFSQNHQTMPYCSLNHQPAYQLVTA